MGLVLRERYTYTVKILTLMLTAYNKLTYICTYFIAWLFLPNYYSVVKYYFLSAAVSTPTEITVGQPTNWHSPASGNLQGRSGTPGERFQSYRCILCQSNDHASLECKYRERLYVH